MSKLIHKITLKDIYTVVGGLALGTLVFALLVNLGILIAVAGLVTAVIATLALREMYDTREKR